MRWLERSVGEPLARAAGQMTLYVPVGVEGFISRQNGSISLRNVLIPIASKPRPEPALEATARLIRRLHLPPGCVTLLHVGQDSSRPRVAIPGNTGWAWREVAQMGEPADTIVATATSVRADLIVMTTEGPSGFLDGLRGSTTQQVLRQAACPVASLPVGSLLG